MAGIADCKESASRNASSFLFEFEQTFDVNEARIWMHHHWKDSFIYALIYVIVIFMGKNAMSTRPRYDLRGALIAWSGLLAAFSTAGAVRTVPGFVRVLQNQGWTSSFCTSTEYKTHPTAVWHYLWVVSKVYELGDTVFIVLRKQPLIFLHWYHHATAMIYSWYRYPDDNSLAQWVMVMNYTVHSLMYTYYTLRALQIKVPRWVNILITCLQLTQMMLSLVIVVSAYRIKSNGFSCQSKYINLFSDLALGLSYFLLFVHFFYITYLKPKYSGKLLGGETEKKNG